MVSCSVFVKWGVRCQNGRASRDAHLIDDEPSRRWGTRISGGCGCAGSLHPTLRKSAKDGAPELLGLVESGSVGYRACLTKGEFCDTAPLKSGGCASQKYRLPILQRRCCPRLQKAQDSSQPENRRHSQSRAQPPRVSDTPPYPTMRLSDRVGHPVLWWSKNCS